MTFFLIAGRNKQIGRTRFSMHLNAFCHKRMLVTQTPIPRFKVNSSIQNPYSPPSETSSIRTPAESLRRWVPALWILGFLSFICSILANAVTVAPPNKWIVSSISYAFLAAAFACMFGAKRLSRR